jgi:hypothetical protein
MNRRLRRRHGSEKTEQTQDADLTARVRRAGRPTTARSIQRIVATAIQAVEWINLLAINRINQAQ